MTHREAAASRSSGLSLLGRIHRGEVLSLLPRGEAERSYGLYQEKRINSVRWTGNEIEADLEGPDCTVIVAESQGGKRFEIRCTSCGEQSSVCTHGVAALLQWLDIRPTMQRIGPGSAWRAHSRHPFVSPARSGDERIDLSHLTGDDLRGALELQLSLHRANTAKARLVGDGVEIRIKLPSGEFRTVVFSAEVLPGALPLLHGLPRLKLEGELSGLELSEARLHPVLLANWTDKGIALVPSYRLADGSMLAREDIADRIHGHWAHLGNYLCRILDPATPLVPFHRRGSVLLTGQDALRFLNLDHPQLLQHSWYSPQGYLAGFRQPLTPKPDALRISIDDRQRVWIRPSFMVDEQPVAWMQAYQLLSIGFSRIGDSIVRAPDMEPFVEAGFRIPKRGAERGLVGSRLALIRLIAHTGISTTEGDEELANLVKVLHGEELPDPGVPPGLVSQLRPYQSDGVRWLWSRYMAGVGALLADDMGLGKTHQIMGLLCHIRARHEVCRFLVVCPRGVLEHWHNLLSMYAPGLKTHIFHGPDRSLDETTSSTCVVLTTYDIMLRSVPELSERSWQVAVFDEAQRIKNPRTKAARAAKKVPADFKVALSGTPLENRLLELWSVIDLIVPGFLGPENDFRSSFRNPTQHQLLRLRERLSILTLRRLKSQVLKDLPDKVEDIRYCVLSPEQRSLYELIHSQQTTAIADQLRDESSEIPYLHIFALLTRLKQLCDHPSLIGEEGWEDAGSGKLEVFDHILEEALAGDHQVVVFSQYVKMIDYLTQHLDDKKIRHLVLTGQTRDRSRIIRRFNSGQHEGVLLASLLAGGVGIDLTGASVVIHYDRWWNPAKENQATDRVHRIGQKRFVLVTKLVTRDTIEEKIDELIRTKLDLMDVVVAPTERVVKGLDRRQLADLLGIEI
ncbi:MAG: DEAD/DEAH box helicase [bacterium]|nr:DEAD/DEAH box helicase [bacterium]